MATKAQIDAFIEQFAPLVQEQCKVHGWGVPSAIIAQAGLESAWNTSGLSKTCFNYWGMKWVNGCGTDYKEYSTKEQRADGTYYTVVSKFRKWSSMSNGINGYFQFIESYKRYIPVIQSKNYIEYSNMLKQCGWATSLKYAINIQNTVKKYDLTKYDTLSNLPNKTVSTTTSTNYPTLKQGSKNEYVRHVQTYLASCGYQVGKIDSIYGARTAACVKQYQIDYNASHPNKIAVDGIWGPQCWLSVGK